MTGGINPLGRSFYERETPDVARRLIGTLLVHETPFGRLTGYVVETEAYRAGDDEASHAYRGVTARNGVMFGTAGHAYVYVSYGIHRMLNIVTEADGSAAAVLIRAIQPVEGIATMARNRALPEGNTSAFDIAGGPGRLCRALGIDLELNGSDVTRPPLYLAPGLSGTLAVVQTTRIGITRSVNLPWRFYLQGSPAVSRRDRRAEANQVANAD